MSIEEKDHAWYVCNKLSFDRRPSTVYQPHYDEAEKGHFTFANRMDHSNIILQFDPDEFPPDWLEP